MIFGLILTVMGVLIAVYSDMVTGVMVAVMGAGILYTFGRMRFGSYKIDSSVSNKIVAHDGNGRYLVKAKTSRQITGPKPHTTGNLPAHLTQVKKGLWMVDRNTSTVLQPGENEVIDWQTVDGDYSIEPRGNGHSNGFLSDEMEGYEHNYIKKGKK